MVQLMVFQTYDDGKAIHTSVETILWMLIFSWASNKRYILSWDAGQWQQDAAPRQPRDHEGKQLMHLQPDNHSVFHFQYSIQ